MKTDRKLRRLKHLVHKYDTYSKFSDRNYLTEQIDIYVKYISDKHCKELHSAYSEIKKLIIELNIDTPTYDKIAREEAKKRFYSYDSLKVNNLKETRDNKGVYVGGGGSNRNKVRYPKKARSKNVWKIFYKMFPWRAKMDEFDGETSKRMK